jgi:hypothetical protein
VLRRKPGAGCYNQHESERAAMGQVGPLPLFQRFKAVSFVKLIYHFGISTGCQ